MHRRPAFSNLARRRAAPPAVAAAILALLFAGSAAAAGPPFPAPIEGQAVYDEAGAIAEETEAALEARIDAIEAESGVETVVYLQVDPGVTGAQNLDKAAALMDQWGVGRRGFDDGLVVLVGLEPDLVHGEVSLFGGSGFTAEHIDPNGMSGIIQNDFVPRARDGDLDGALLATVDAVAADVAPSTVPGLTAARQLNAIVGLAVAPIVLLGSLALAWLTWRRRGRDPYFLDSPSILMAGPPAEMTPALATVVTGGRASQQSLNTVLVQLASAGRIGFWNLDRVSSAKSDDEPDPETDPAILIHGPARGATLPAEAEQAWSIVKREAAGRERLTRESLWGLNDALAPVNETLETTALRLGWFTERPRLAISRMRLAGGIELAAGVVSFAAGLALPASGLVLLGIALVLGGVAVIGIGGAMSQRTPNGARVDGMLRAYRRTLQKTMEQARSMDAVVAHPTVRLLAGTPDEAVVWGIALGLHEEVAAVLERSLEDQAAGASTGATYYPHWLGSSPGVGYQAATATGTGGTVRAASGGLFSPSAVPNLAGMFAALDSIGTTPASSSSGGSGGGGFSGGSSSGGGGSSGSF